MTAPGSMMQRGDPGTVIDVSDDGFTVAAGEGAVKIFRVRPKGGQKVAAGEYMGGSGASIGTRFG